MSRVWDCFMFNHELDILRCRLEECQDAVYRHVLVEARVDHQGHPKPLHFDENKQLFAPWLDRIEHVIVDTLPEAQNPWVRENAQRNHAFPALAATAWPDDLVLLADVDEIPNAAALAARPQVPSVLMMKCYLYAVDWMWPDPMQTTVLAPMRTLNADLSGCRIGAQTSPPARIFDAGWHMTWLGGPEAQLAKADMHCHIEFNDAIKAGAYDFYRLGTHPWRVWSAQDLIPVNVDATWPRMVYERRCPENWFRPR